MSIQLSLLPVSAYCEYAEKIPDFSAHCEYAEKIPDFSAYCEYAEKTTTNSESERLEKQLDILRRFLNKDEPKYGFSSIQIYQKSYYKKSYSYYHFCYWNGKKVQHKHICGGRVGSPKVERRVRVINQMINRKAPVAEILKLIAAFK
jgi:hypothetical protein